MKNKNTATITWLKYNNFGTYLQAYALQQTIMSLGYANHILDDSSIVSSRTFSNYLKYIVGTVLAKLSFTNRKYRQLQRESDALYARFANRYLNIDKTSASVLKDADLYYDQYICGSDQIWSPMLEKHLNPYYYAHFTTNKKIAYAASFGVEAYPEKLRDEFIALASSFATISCREEIGCCFVRDILGKEAAHVLDPTLLLSDENWRNVASSSVYKKEGNEHYMLTYFLTPNKWYVDFSRHYAAEKGLKLKTFFLRCSSIQEADEAVVAGPAEFIWLIDHADVFLTDSFHGSIFATLMDTPFFGFQRFSNENGGQNHRLMDLYRLMGIDKWFIRNKNRCDIIRTLPSMDFAMMKKNLKPAINSSIKELSLSLSI